jgi:PAS domain S-box-containing protein
MDLPGRTLAPRRRAATRDTSTAAMWRDLNVIALRVGAWVGPLTGVAYLFGFFDTSDPAYLVLAGLALVIGLVSIVQRRRGVADARLILYTGGTAVFLGGAITPPMVRGGLWAAIAVIAIVGSLLLDATARRRFTVFMGFLLVAQLAWPVLGRASLADTIANLVVSGTCFFLGVLAVTLTKQALEDSERIRLDIFRRVPIGLFRASADGEIIDANPAMCQMVGWKAGSLVGTRIADLHVAPDDWRLFAGSLASDRTPQRFAHRMRTSDGSIIWVRGYAQAVHDEFGEVSHLEGSIEDVTQRREIEEKSRINTERFRAVFELAPIAIWEEDFTEVGARLADLRSSGVTDLGAYLAAKPAETQYLLSLVRYVDVNPAGVALISAHSTSEALTKVVPESPSPDLLSSFVDQFMAIWDNQEHLTREVSGTTVDGRPLDLALSWAAGRGEDGSMDLSHVVVAIADVSAIRAAERELAALILSKDELVASVSHELRTPITTILGMAFELRDHADEFGLDETRQFISYIADQSRELSNIVDDLLVAARSDDTLAVRPEVVDLQDEVVEMLASNPSGPKPEIVIGGPVLAWADPLRLRQIVRNLLTNARRYGGPKVTIEAGHESRGIFLRVRDDGAGVPTADREKVFEPYTRVGGDAGLPGSIGLGLPVSRRLARLMGGDLTYRYENGSVFELTLPEPARRAAA